MVDSPVVRTIFVPYINRGKLPPGKRKPHNGIRDAVNYDVTFFESGWSPARGKSVPPPIQNPYRREQS